jgi:hypothetical protein
MLHAGELKILQHICPLNEKLPWETAWDCKVLFYDDDGGEESPPASPASQLHSSSPVSHHRSPYITPQQSARSINSIERTNSAAKTGSSPMISDPEINPAVKTAELSISSMKRTNSASKPGSSPLPKDPENDLLTPTTTSVELSAAQEGCKCSIM